MVARVARVAKVPKVEKVTNSKFQISNMIRLQGLQRLGRLPIQNFEFQIHYGCEGCEGCKGSKD